jgi:putative ABC transport system permease protein
MLGSLRYGIRRLLSPRQSERDLTDEVQQLLDMTADEYVRRGMSRDEAMRRARLDFGGVESVKEQLRTTGWESVVDSVWRDVRYAMRGMARTPMFTIIVTATLALGIGANTAMFSVLNAVMLRPLPYADASRLVLLWTDDIKRGLHNESTAYSTIEEWRRLNRTFEDIAFFNSGRATIGTGPTGVRTRAAFVSGHLFGLIGASARLGRSITAQDAQDRATVAVISHALWIQRFGATPDVIGTAIEIAEWQGKDGPTALTIVGVMPPDFYFPDRSISIWTPATTYWRWQRESTERFESWARRWIAIGRLRAGASFDDAGGDLARVGEYLTTTSGTPPPDFPGFTVNVVPILESITGTALPRALSLLMAAVALVLLVACANVAHLILARGASRQQELAMRRALGASRWRLIRQQLIESACLGLAGGIAGGAVAIGLTRIITTLAAQRIPRLDDSAVDARVLAFAASAALISVFIFGLLPALRVTNPGRLEISRPYGKLMIVECALAVVVLVGAGLLLRSLALVLAVDPGFDPTHALIARVQFPAEVPTAANRAMSESDRARQREQVQQALLERIASLPDVEAAGYIDDLYVGAQGHASIVLPGMDMNAIAPGELHEGSVSPDLFATLGVPLKAGRDLRRDDGLIKIRALWSPAQPNDLPLEVKAQRAIREPAIVNESFVKRYLSGRDPIGQSFCVSPLVKTYCYEIVGVVGDMHRQGLERAAIAQYFGPYVAQPSGRVDLIVRTRGAPLAAAPSIKSTIAAVVPDGLVAQVSTAADGLGDFSAQRTLQTLLFSAFAFLALVLAAVGVYGMVHYAVAQRRREIGVRIAIGARPVDVFVSVIGRAMRWPVIGVALGLAAAAIITQVMAHLLFGIEASDPATFIAVAATLLITALIASYGPARRAARIDPVTALRVE